MLVHPEDYEGPRPRWPRFLRWAGAAIVLLLVVQAARAILAPDPSRIPSAGETVADSGCAGRPVGGAAGDRWAVLDEEYRVWSDDLRGDRRPLVQLDLAGLTPARGKDRIEVSALRHGERLWLLAQDEHRARIWVHDLTAGTLLSVDIEAPAPRVVQQWDASDGTAVLFVNRDRSVRRVDHVTDDAGSTVLAVTSLELPGPALAERERPRLVRGDGAIWIDRTGQEPGVEGRLDRVADDGGVDTWAIPSDLSFGSLIADGECLWVASESTRGCRSEIAAFRPGHRRAVVARDFAGCLLTIDVGDGRIAATTGETFRLLDPRTGAEVLKTTVFSCGDGSFPVVHDARLFAVDDCDGALVELSPEGDVLQEVDLFALDDEPMDVVASVSAPWVISGSWEAERLYHLDDLEAEGLPLAPELDLLVPL